MVSCNRVRIEKNASAPQDATRDWIGRRSGALLPLLATLVALACASSTGPTREDVLADVPPVAALQAAVESAQEDGIDLLAPQGTNAAERALDEAVRAAQRGNEDEAARLARQGIERLEKARRESARTAEALRDILLQRRSAIEAGAPDLLPDRFEALDRNLRSAARMAEEGNLEEAKDAGPALLEGYSSLELDSLKVDATELARVAIDTARDAGAERYASRTFGRARQEFDLAVGILETDRAEVRRANVHARRAAELATRSQHLAELVKEFDRRDYDREQVVLWYQQQLEAVASPLEGDVEFVEPNHVVVEGLREQVASLVDAHAETSAELAAAQEKIKDLEVATTLSAHARKEAEARYDRIQAMFSEDEANVYRQGLNVLLETYGFDFPVGESEIRSNNFPLLNRIAKAIREFPDPKVIVSGHTDAVGDTELNQELSEERARKVGDFLVEVAEIDRKQVTTRGFGESKPVATNETPEGRARNRRIEILILNR